MRENIIKIKQFEYIDFLNVEITKKMGEHVTATVVGMVSEENALKYIEQHHKRQPVTFIGYDEYGKEKILFHGLISDLSVTNQNGVNILNESFENIIKKNISLYFVIEFDCYKCNCCRNSKQYYYR